MNLVIAPSEKQGVEYLLDRAGRGGVATIRDCVTLTNGERWRIVTPSSAYTTWGMKLDPGERVVRYNGARLNDRGEKHLAMLVSLRDMRTRAVARDAVRELEAMAAELAQHPAGG